MLSSKQRMLMPLKGERGFNYAVFDIEATKWVNVILCGFYDGETYRSFRTVREFLDFFLCNKYRSWRCFIHNSSGYDGQFLLDTLTHDFPGHKYEVLSNNGPSMIKVSKKYGERENHWIFLDSYRLLPRSLKDLTASFDVPHKKEEMDYENIEKDWAKLEEYLEYDCRGLYEVLKKFESWFAVYKVPLKPTTASQAMSIYRKMMPRPLPLLSNEVEEFIRRAYFGGRTEVFKMRCQDKLNLYDVRSLYPYVMKQYPMPIGPPRKVYQYDPDSIGFYKCRVKIPEMYIPPLPHVITGKLLFPCGEFSGYYTSKEIDVARELGCKVYIDVGWTFAQDYIFSEYIDRFFSLKQSGDGVTREIAKLMLNSLYGKFGQNREKLVTVHPTEFDPDEELIPYMLEYGLYQKKTTSTANFIIPSISAWITSCARFELLKWLNKAGDDSVYYCDTDSVITTKRLPTGDALGDMKLETTADGAIFLLPKLYILRSGEDLTVKAKGFERSFAKTLTMDSFEKALNGDKRAFSYQVNRFAKFKEALKREGVFVTMLSKKKSIQSTYSKRTIGKDFNTFPFLLNEPRI